MANLRYPIGMQSFQEIRENGYLYVDKTRYIHELASGGKYYFLSRPRRFGKSLLISTIEQFLKGITICLKDWQSPVSLMIGTLILCFILTLQDVARIR